MSAPTTERNQEMRALRAQGYTLQDIAHRYGVTRQRVEQLTRGVVRPLVPTHGERSRRVESLYATRVEILRPLLTGDDRVRPTEAAVITGIPRQVVSQVARQEGWIDRKRWTQEECVTALLQWHKHYGQLPTSYDWSAKRSRHPRGVLLSYPSASTVTLRCGSWDEARQAAMERLA